MAAAASGGGFGHFQAEHHAALLPLAGKNPGGLAVQQQLQIFPVRAAQALPGPDFLILAGFEQSRQTTRLKLSGISQLHPLRPMGKLLVIGAGQRGQPFQVGPPRCWMASPCAASSVFSTSSRAIFSA